MAFATVYLESMVSYNRSSRSLAYKSETIKAINANLDSPETALSDSTIGAVAMLMAIEVSTRVLSGYYNGSGVHQTAEPRHKW